MRWRRGIVNARRGRLDWRLRSAQTVATLAVTHPATKLDMSRTATFSLFVILHAAFAPVTSADDPPTKPNILVLCCDDLRPDTIHALGNATIETPNLDRLVERGATFTRAITAYPLCYPSRGEILTGTSTLRTGYPDRTRTLDATIPTWPETLRRAGYRTYYVGKWHTSGRPKSHGYTETLGLFDSGPAPKTPSLDHRGFPITGYVGYQFQDDAGNRFPERGVGLTPNISQDFADAAIELVRRDEEGPFFAHVNFTAPHDPRLMPTGYEAKYDRRLMPLPANFAPEHPFDHGNLRGRDEALLPWPRTPDDVRWDLSIYYAIITHLDAQIGRVMAALEAADKLDDTLVIFTSDHGLALGSHGLTGKQNMYEHTIGVPLIFAGPGVPSGVRRATQCYLRDLFPTTCELAGIDVPASVQGTSLAGALRGEVDEAHPFVVAYFRDTQRMIRTNEWKLIWYPHLDRHQLFNVKNDPDELRDLVDAPELSGLKAELKEKLMAWLIENGDTVAADKATAR